MPYETILTHKTAQEKGPRRQRERKRQGLGRECVGRASFEARAGGGSANQRAAPGHVTRHAAALHINNYLEDDFRLRFRAIL